MIKHIKSRNLYEVHLKNGKVFSYSESKFGIYAKNIAEISNRLENGYIFTKEEEEIINNIIKMI